MILHCVHRTVCFAVKQSAQTVFGQELQFANCKPAPNALRYCFLVFLSLYIACTDIEA